MSIESNASFEELINGRDVYGRKFSDFEINLMRTVYNLAIDEALKAANFINHYRGNENE